MLKVKPMTVKP